MIKVLLSVLALSYFLRYACRAWVIVENGGWGDWFSKINQPVGYLACGMAVRNDPYDPCRVCDNTAINAIKIIWCRMDNWSIQQSSLLNDGWYGQWLSNVMCADGHFIYGIRTKFQLWVSGQDDMALTGIEMKCRHSVSNAIYTVMVLDSSFGGWNYWVESSNQYICGGGIRFEQLTKEAGDATALNGLQVNFCDYKCESKVTNCSKCNLINPCIECNAGYYLYNSSGSNSCINPCPSGFRSDSNSNPPSCIACEIANCVVCPSSISCKSCKASYFLDNSTLNTYCVTTCPYGYKADSNTQSCIACSISNCNDCSPGINSCNSCKTDYFLDTSTRATFCVSKCPSGYRGDSTALPSKCVACSVIYCDTCHNDMTCLVCKATYFLHVINSTYTCEKPCPSGFRGDISLSPNACVACSVKSCNICSTSSDCLACLNGYFLLIIGPITTCEEDCPRGYRVDRVSNPPSCIPCEVSYCDICDNSGRCIECKYNYYLHTEDITTSCELECPSGFREDLSSVPSCVRCEIPNCDECSEISSCIECKTGLFLYIKDDISSCEIACPPGYREDISSPPFSCIPCDVSNCEICSSFECIECKNNYYLYTYKDTTTCEETCPIGYGSDTSLRPFVCKSCDTSHCKRCGSYDVCYECEDEYYLIFIIDTYNCVQTCPSGFASVQDGNIRTCKECLVSKCQICNELNECDRCDEGYLLININGSSRCIDNCDGIGDENCLRCTIEFCKRCYQDICIECFSPTFLNDDGRCICPSENYHIVDKSCIPNPFSVYISSSKDNYLDINFSATPFNSITSSDYTLEYTIPDLSSLLSTSLLNLSSTSYSITFSSIYKLNINSSLSIIFKDSVKDAISQSLSINKYSIEVRFYSSSDCIPVDELRDCKTCSISNESLKSCYICDSSCRCISAFWLTCTEIVPKIEVATWNSDMLGFTMRFNIQIQPTSLLNHDCSYYFTSSSLSQLGISPICTLSQDLLNLTVIIGTDCNLTTTSDISLNNQISSAYNPNKNYDNTNPERIIPPSQYPNPTAVLIIPSIITYCNVLKGDGSQSFGNRRQLRYDWSVSGNNSEIISNISDILRTETGSIITISSEFLRNLTEITINMNVTNVYGMSHSTTATVSITEEFVPEVIFQGGSEIKILSTATYTPQIILKWPVCKSPPTSYSTEWSLTPISEGQTTSTRKLQLYSNNKQSYTITPGMLKADISYNLTVTVIPDTTSKDALPASLSQIITALPAPMFVNIARGDRLASIYKNAILDGSLSNDASYPDLDLSYSWSCKESNIECDFMKNMNTTTSKELFLPANTMKPDLIYTFTLTVSNLKRSSSTSAYLHTLSATNIPEVYLLTYEIKNPTKYINYLNPNYIVLANNEISEFEDLKLQWRIIGGPYILNSPSNQRSVAIREGTLKYGIYYTFTLEVTYEDYFATSSLTLYVNTPPIRGSLNISPYEGNELEIYTFITSGWEDVENNYPIRYDLYKDVDNLLVKVIDLNYATMYEGVLSAGSEYYGYSTTYYMNAYDSLGAYSSISSNVIVYPITQDEAESIAFGKIDNLSQNKDVIESLDSIPYTVITLSDSISRFDTDDTNQDNRKNFVKDCVDLLSFYSEIDIDSTRQAASVISTLERLTVQPQLVNEYTRNEALRMLSTSITQNEGNFKLDSVKQSVEIASNLYLSSEKDNATSYSTKNSNSISYYSLLNSLGLAVVKSNIRNQELLEFSTNIYKVLYQRVSPSTMNSNFKLQDSQIIFPSSISGDLKLICLSRNSVLDLSFIYSQQNFFTNYSSSFNQSLYHIKNAGVMYLDVKYTGYENDKGGIEYQQIETIELSNLKSPIEIYITGEYINITDQIPECVYLNENCMKWENTGCRFKEYLEDLSQIVCECFHMSYYSVADFKIDLYQAVEENRAEYMNPYRLLEAKFEDFYSFVIVMGLILLIHIVTSVYAYILDRKDRKTRLELIPQNEASRCESPSYLSFKMNNNDNTIQEDINKQERNPPKPLKSVHPILTEGLYMVYQEVEMQRKSFSQLFVLKHKLLELRYIRNHSLSKLSRLSLLFYSIYANIFVLGFFYSIEETMNFEDQFKQMARGMEFEIRDLILFIYTKLVVLAPFIVLKWLLTVNIKTFKRSMKNWIGIILIASGYIGSLLGIILLAINFRKYAIIMWMFKAVKAAVIDVMVLSHVNAFVKACIFYLIQKYKIEMAPDNLANSGSIDIPNRL